MTRTIDVTCPRCLAPAGKRCRALTTGRSTDYHVARAELAWQWRRGATR